MSRRVVPNSTGTAQFQQRAALQPSPKTPQLNDTRCSSLVIRPLRYLRVCLHGTATTVQEMGGKDRIWDGCIPCCECPIVCLFHLYRILWTSPVFSFVFIFYNSNIALLPTSAPDFAELCCTDRLGPRLPHRRLVRLLLRMDTEGCALVGRCGLGDTRNAGRRSSQNLARRTKVYAHAQIRSHCCW